MNQKIQKIILRFLKYNIIGSMCWVTNFGIYTFIYYPYLHFWSIIPFSISGAIIEFTALSIANRSVNAEMFVCKVASTLDKSGLDDLEADHKV